MTHDSATWGSGDTVPTVHTATISNLRQALSRVQEYAIEWNPRPVAEVFSVVHAIAMTDTLDRAPEIIVYATINLYTYVFTGLFQSIRDNALASSLVPEARAILSHDSADYIRLVRHVMDTAIVDTWAHHQGQEAVLSRRSDHRSRPNKGRHNPRSQQSRSTFLSAILTLMPKKEGTSTCLRFQTKRGRDFPSCKNVHDLVTLKDDVLQYLKRRHGDLKDNHQTL